MSRSTYVWCSRSKTFLVMARYIMMVVWWCFPFSDLNLGSLALIGVFLIHQAVQVLAISCTPLSAGWAPAVNLVPLASLHRSQIHQSEDNTVCTPWISPLQGLNPRPSQTPLQLLFIGTVVPIQTCMGQCVNILRHSAGSLRWGSLANKQCAAWLSNVHVPQ